MLARKGIAHLVSHDAVFTLRDLLLCHRQRLVPMLKEVFHVYIRHVIQCSGKPMRGGRRVAFYRIDSLIRLRDRVCIARDGVRCVRRRPFVRVRSEERPALRCVRRPAAPALQARPPPLNENKNNVVNTF